MFEDLRAMFSSPTFSVALDILLLFVLLVAWFLWWKQSQRSQRIESGLLEAAAQLQEATRLLDDALNQIAILQGKEAAQSVKKAPEVPQAVAKEVMQPVGLEDDFDDDVRINFSSQSRQRLNAQREELLASQPRARSESLSIDERRPNKVKSSGLNVAQILRMEREGASLENIASTLDIPLAQVKLMLMLQKGA